MRNNQFCVFLSDSWELGHAGFNGVFRWDEKSFIILKTSQSLCSKSEKYVWSSHSKEVFTATWQVEHPHDHIEMKAQGS